MTNDELLARVEGPLVGFVIFVTIAGLAWLFIGVALDLFEKPKRALRARAKSGDGR